MERIYKKTYTTPSAEKIEFNYQNQVVAESGTSGCTYRIENEYGYGCTNRYENYVA